MAFVTLATIATWLGREFNTIDGPASRAFAERVAGVPLHYLIAAGVIVGLAPLALRKPPVWAFRALSSVGLLGWVLAGALAVSVAILTAIATSADELFADWRNLGVFAAVAALTFRWIASQPWAVWAPLDLAIAYGILSLGPVALWALGGGTVSLGIRIPLFSGAHLQLASYAALLTFAAWMWNPRVKSGWYFRAVQASLLFSSALVLLSFRRSYWLMWGLGITAILGFALAWRGVARARVASAVVAASTLTLAATLVLGPNTVVERVESFLPGSENAFTLTNSDHVNDILDAIDVIGEDPLLGYGIGRAYRTNRIRAWKEFSFEVHNAPVHVWLKFGLLGLIAYLGFHVQWIRIAASRRLDAVWRPISFGIAIFLAVELLASLGGTWPYGKFQLSIHHGLLLGLTLAMATHRTANRQRVPSSTAAKRSA